MGVTDVCPKVGQSSALACENAELVRQNLELQADIEWLMSCNSIKQQQEQFLASQAISACPPDSVGMRRTASGATAMSRSPSIAMSRCPSIPMSRSPSIVSNAGYP